MVMKLANRPPQTLRGASAVTMLSTRGQIVGRQDSLIALERTTFTVSCSSPSFVTRTSFQRIRMLSAHAVAWVWWQGWPGSHLHGRHRGLCRLRLSGRLCITGGFLLRKGMFELAWVWLQGWPGSHLHGRHNGLCRPRLSGRLCITRGLTRMQLLLGALDPQYLRTHTFLL